eukprot:983453-Amphidinium_carterae.1
MRRNKYIREPYQWDSNVEANTLESPRAHMLQRNACIMSDLVGLLCSAEQEAQFIDEEGYFEAHRALQHADSDAEDNPIKHEWTCCKCNKVFPKGEEDDDIRFCSSDDCQHVMCEEHSTMVGLRYVIPGLAKPTTRNTTTTAHTRSTSSCSRSKSG